LEKQSRSHQKAKVERERKCRNLAGKVWRNFCREEDLKEAGAILL